MDGTRRIASAVSCLALVATAACSGRGAISHVDGSAGTSDMLSSKFCTDARWCASNTDLQSNDLAAVWGSGPDDVWAVGASGTILHWDGRAWSQRPSGTAADLFDVWGSAANDVWAVGDGVLLHWDGSSWGADRFVLVGGAPVGSEGFPLRSLWGSGAHDVWAFAGQSYAQEGDVRTGAVLHFDGEAWSLVTTPNHEPIGGSWGSGPSDVWAFADLSSVIHFDGTRWSSVTDPPAMFFAAGRAWGSGPRDLWLSGGAFPFHFDGTSWSDPGCGEIPCSFTSAGVWGAAANDVWTVGYRGGIGRWNGTSWAFVASPTLQNLSDVWGSGANDVWAVGAAGAIIHWDGARWSGQGVTKANALAAVWGSGPDDVWAVGENSPDGYGVHWGGHGWSEVVIARGPSVDPLSAPPIEETFRAVWGSGPDDVWAVGDENQVGMTYHWDGRAWSNVNVPTAGPLYAVWGSAPDDVWTGGGAGGLLALARWDGLAWSKHDFVDDIGQIQGLWGTSAREVWAVGIQGLIARYDGVNWTEVGPGQGHPEFPSSFNALWGSATNDVWAVGGNMPYPTPGLPGAGTIWHWDGSAWAEALTGGLPTFHAAWGSGPDDVWAVGGDGDGAHNLAHWDGKAWSLGSTGTKDVLRGVWGRGPGDLFVVGDRGVVLHHSPAQ